MHVFVNGLATPGSPAVLPPREVDFPRPSGLLGCTSPLPGEERVPDLVDRRVRRHHVTQCLDRDLGDDGECGRLGEFGELGSDEGCAEQGVRVGVDDQFRPSVESVAEDGEVGYGFRVTRGARRNRESVSARLTFGSSHFDDLRVGVHDLWKVVRVAGDEFVVRELTASRAAMMSATTTA